IDHAAHDADQIAHARLEELIARVGLDYVHRGFGVVAGGIQAEMSDDAVDLVRKQRDFARTAVVHRRSEQAEEAPFAAHAPRSVERLHSYVIEIRGAMHGRYRVCFGDDQQLDRARSLAQLALEARWLDAHAGPLAQDAEPGLRYGFDRVFAATALEAVFAIAEEGEMVVRHPFEQRARLAHLVRAHRRRVRFQLLADAQRLLAHRLPVLHGQPHVAERLQDSALQVAQPRLVGDPIYVHVLPRFARPIASGAFHVRELGQSPGAIAPDGEHRLTQHVTGPSGLRQQHGERVDQEGHVFGDDFDDGVRTAPALRRRVGVVDAH